MTAHTATGFNPSEVSARIMVDALLGRFRFNVDSDEFEIKKEIRPVLIQLHKQLGLETMEQLVTQARPVLHALADACFDAVVGIESDETKAAILRLPVPQRTVLEAVVIQMTGKSDARGGHWAPFLWHSKNRIDKLCRLSLTNLTKEEIRTGYNEMMHLMIDKLCDEWRTLAH